MGAPGAEVTLGPGVLVPCVVQDAVSGEVLMLAHVDDEALAATRDTGLAHFHSRSRDQLWQKGATSGHTMAVESLAFDCDGDTVLLRVTPAGPACHTGEETCFGPRLIDRRPAVMAELAAVIEDRRARQQGASYVAGILGGEREQAQRKVGEEAVEVLLAAPGSPELVAEVADLWFHSMLLLARDGLDPLAPLEELRRRRQAPR
jgi:phosphoribosyl-AMP cyclohydrolase / phosphoribosyl-ATP pyrophosphohydrolase